MAQKKRPTKKIPVTQVKKAPRKLQQPAYKSFRLHKRIRPAQPAITGSFRLLKKTLLFIRLHWRFFVKMALVYGLLMLFLVRGLSSNLNIEQIRSTANEIATGKLASFIAAGAALSTLVSSTGSSTIEGATGYQPLLVISTGLAIIWALRQLFTGRKITVRDSFYKGLYPLVPFFIILIVISLQLMPLSFGAWLFSTVISQFIAVTVLEKSLWFILFMLLSVLSFYMISSSIFALFIVALPDMTPMRALRSARQLVLHRRWIVMRKVLFVPFILAIFTAVVMLPVLIWVSILGEGMYFILSTIGLPFAVTYLYHLYRELLNE